MLFLCMNCVITARQSLLKGQTVAEHRYEAVALLCGRYVLVVAACHSHQPPGALPDDPADAAE